MSNFAPPPMPVFEDKPKFPWRVIVIIAIAIIIVAWSFFIGLLLGSETGGIQESENLPISDDVVIDDTEAVTDQTESGTPATVADAQTLQVDWVDLAGQKARATNSNWNQVVFGDETLSPEDGVGPKAFALGTIKGGAYDGRELQMYIAGKQGMGVDYEMYYLINGGSGDLVVLDRYASRVGEAFSRPTRQITASELLGEDRLAQLVQFAENTGDMSYTKIILDTGSKVAELEEVVSAKDDRGYNYKLVGEWVRTDYPVDISFVKSAISVTLLNGQVMSESAQSKNKPFADNLFFYIRQDGRMVFYTLDLGIGIDQADGESMGVPNVIWTDGTNNSATYTMGAVGGCGSSNSYSVVDDELMSTLIESGRYLNSSGYKTLVLAPKEYPADWRFNMWQSSHEGKTLSDYSALHPYFYIQDSFGRLIEFQGTDFLSPAECGKPVIYLYPTKTTDIDVTLKPTGGFSYTEPVYQNGWRVTASPDGTLVNRDDGKTYPYLFWEGRGGLYSSPTKFWVVKKADVHSFLVSTLAKLGLNQKETADFIEFWEPRMQSAPYYQIGFHGTDVMNQIAPLTLSQKADTTLRILMDYQELSAPIKSNPPILPATPVRKGFTVVEWGGVLR